MREVLPSAAEQAPQPFLPDQWTALGTALLSCASSDPAGERAILDTAVQTISGSLITPSHKTIVETAGGVLAWQLFGQPGDPLPQGILKVADPKTGQIELLPDPRCMGRDHYNINVLTNALYSGPVGTMLAERRQRLIDGYADHIEPSLVTAAQSTPIGNTLWSFAAHPQAEDGPLPPPIYQSRAAQMREDVTTEVRDQAVAAWRAARARAPLAAQVMRAELPHLKAREQADEQAIGSQPLEAYPGGRQRLSRAMVRLDLETMRQTAESRPDPFAQARSAVSQWVSEGLAAEGVICTGPLQYTNHGLRVETDQGMHDITDFDLKRLLPHSQAPFDYASKEFLETYEISLATSLFTNQAAGDYEAFLRRHLANTFINGYYGFGVGHDETMWGRNIHAALKQPPGPVIPKAAYPRADIGGLSLTFAAYDIAISGQESMQTRSQQVIGEWRRTPYAQHKDSMHGRIVVSDQPMPENFVSDFSQADAVVVLANQKPGMAAFMPGMAIVGIRHYAVTGETAYAFRRDETGEPYVPCLVPVPEAGRRLLAEQYTHIGMSELARRILTAPELTVDDLVSHIQSRSTYIVPKYSLQASGGNESGLYGLKSYVNDGIFQTQCTGAAHFLRYSLETAFNQACAQIIEGISLGGGLLTEADHHAQVAANLDGHLYILDATPGNWRMTIAADRRAPHATGAHLPDTSLEPYEELQANLQQTQNQLTLRQALAGLHTLLSTIYQTPDDNRLYDKVVALPPNDPALHTMRAAYDVMRGSPDARDQVSRALSYVENVIQCTDIRALKELGLAGYSPVTLALLRNGLAALRQSLIHERSEA